MTCDSLFGFASILPGEFTSFDGTAAVPTSSERICESFGESDGIVMRPD